MYVLLSRIQVRQSTENVGTGAGLSGVSEEEKQPPRSKPSRRIMRVMSSPQGRMKAAVDSENIDYSPGKGLEMKKDLMEFKGLKNTLDNIREETKRLQKQMKQQKEDHKRQLEETTKQRQEQWEKEDVLRKKQMEAERVRHEAELEEQISQRRSLQRLSPIGYDMNLGPPEDKSVWMEVQYEKELQGMRSELDRVRSEMIREREQRLRAQEEQELWLMEAEQRRGTIYNGY